MKGSIITVLGNFHEFQLGLMVWVQPQALSSLSKASRAKRRNMIDEASVAQEIEVTAKRGSASW